MELAFYWSRVHGPGSNSHPGVTGFNALTVADMNSAYDAGLERLYQFDTAAVIAALANFMDAALQSVEGGVAPSPVNQLIVRTILDQAPMVQRQDAIGVANRRQAVGDNEN